MVWWFSGQITLGSGAYTRTTPNYSAKKTWAGLRNNYSLLWIAIVLGVDEETITAAYAEMNTVKNLGSKCSAIRKHIPYETIHDLASKYLPDPQQAKKLSHVFDGVASIKEKLDSKQISDLTAELEKELLRTPVFDVTSQEDIVAWFEPVASYLLIKYGVKEDELDSIAPEVCNALYQLAMK